MAQSEVENAVTENTQPVPATNALKSQPRKSILSRIWNGIFRSSNEDFEKRLQHLSKEEASVHARTKRRSETWRKLARALIIYPVICEVVAIVIAIMSTKTPDLTWQMRALRVLPVFALPGFSALLYSTCSGYFRMCERKDQKTLDKLRAERKAKIDELKERTNYYLTQQLIQRYDLDPAAKAAAASVLASKLGAESGLNFTIQDDAGIIQNQAKSHDVEVVPSAGLRNRKHLHGRSVSDGSISTEQLAENQDGSAALVNPQGGTRQQGYVVEHHQRGSASEGGWISRLAAMLVGEDPSQCYALICGNCHMHNGLARKEDFPYVTYYCPHCHVLNGSPQAGFGDIVAASGSSSLGTDRIEGKVGENQVPSSDAKNISNSEVVSKLANASVSETAKETEGTESRELAN